MKRYSLIICLVLILSLSGVASAQVVMLEDAGGIANVRLHTSGSFTYSFTTSNYYNGPSLPLLVGYTSSYVYMPIFQTTATWYPNLQAAFEFNLSPVIPPTFTSNDFTAKLDGLNVTNSYAYYTDGYGAMTGIMNVDLFDMGDGTEDGDVYYNDYNSRRGGRIARLAHDFAPGGAHADFTNIDVTCAVRNDLFGAGQTDFSGFILKSPDARYELVWYDDDDAILTINVGNPGPKCGGGGGSGGGGCFIANAAR
jgi:hypothetical protein